MPCGPLPQALDGLGPCPFLSFLRAARIVHRRCRCCLRCRCPCQRPAPGRRQEAHPQEDRLRPHARQELRPRGKQSVMLGVAHGAVVRFRMGEKKGEDLPSTATGLGRRPRVSTLSSPFSFVSLLRTFQITIFDHRGCARKGVEYKGELSGGTDDEMCVKVAQTQLKIDSPAAKELATSVLAVSRNLNPFCASGDSAGYHLGLGLGSFASFPGRPSPLARQVPEDKSTCAGWRVRGWRVLGGSWRAGSMVEPCKDWKFRRGWCAHERGMINEIGTCSARRGQRRCASRVRGPSLPVVARSVCRPDGGGIAPLWSHVGRAPTSAGMVWWSKCVVLCWAWAKQALEV